MIETKKPPKTILLQSAIGDWTIFKPLISERKKQRSGIRSGQKLSDKELYKVRSIFLELFEKYISALQKNLNLPFTLFSISIDQMTTIEILKAVNAELSQFRLNLKDDDYWQICFDAQISNLFVNRSVGGDISGSISRGLTEIEESILSICGKIGLDILACQNQENISIEFVNFPSMFFDQTYSETLPYILLTFEIEFGKGQKGYIYLVIPINYARKLLTEKEEASPQIQFTKLNPQITEKIKIPISARLGTAYISAKELYELEEGDVIMLDSSINSLLSLKIEKDLQLFGQPGIKDDKISIKIIQNKPQKFEKIKSELIAEEEILDYPESSDVKLEDEAGEIGEEIKNEEIAPINGNEPIDKPIENDFQEENLAEETILEEGQDLNNEEMTEETIEDEIQEEQA